MKYMGSKRAMLSNGLGDLLDRQSRAHDLVVDLFAGSGAVGCWISERVKVPVHSYDLQRFAVSLSASIVCRTQALEGEASWLAWYARALAWLQDRELFPVAVNPLAERHRFGKATVLAARRKSADNQCGRITQAYGGYYLSLQQALWTDALRSTIPRDTQVNQVALASLIRAVSSCCASPGHTAQPLRPTERGVPAIYDAWRKNVVNLVQAEFIDLCGRRALRKGSASVGDANAVAKDIPRGALVFVDPPYSAVHYSRFYHVLESVVHERLDKVEGAGRYPPPKARPKSDYSISTKAKESFVDLLKTLANRKATVVVTYPYRKCSNGLSGQFIESQASSVFKKVERKLVRGRFSTLGGNGSHREARQPSAELILLMRP